MVGKSLLCNNYNYTYYFISFCFIFLQSTQITVTQNVKGIKSGGPSKTRVTSRPQWIQESLDTHNFFRSLHGAPPLVLNNSSGYISFRQLSEISQYYADYLLQRNLGSVDAQGHGSIYFEHSLEAHQARLGENLYYSLSTKMTEQIDSVPGPFAVNLWYEEIKDYNFTTAKRKTTSDPEAMIGHLTQVLWKNTRQMGTAVASSKLPNNQILVFVVANYWPAGNWNKEEFYLQNVLPPSLSEADINAAIVSRNVQSWWKESGLETNTPESWRESALNAHNSYRSQHGAQLLRLNSDVCKVSQLWANHLLERGLQSFNLNGVLHQMESNILVRRCHFGENSMQFITPEDDLSAEQVVKLWYNQVKNYDFIRASETSSPISRNLKTESFERIVWNSTTEFCISYARKKADNGQFLNYVVAYYYPSITNERKDKKRNVFPSTGSSSGSTSTGTTILIIFLTILFILLCLVGSMFLLYKFKLPWYESIMKTVRVKK